MKQQTRKRAVTTFLPLTPMERNVLLRSLATANDAERTSASDQAVNTWLAERLLTEIERERADADR